MITIYYNDAAVTKLPESFEEMTAPQMLAVAPFLLKHNPDEYERTVIALLLLQTNQLFSISASKKKAGYDYLADELRVKLVPGLAWLFEKNTFTTNLFPMLKVPDGRFPFFTTKFYGPASNFDNITLDEYADAEFCLAEYARTNAELWLIG